MKGFNFIPYNTNINFIRYRIIFFLFSFLMVLISIISLLYNGLNYGIDFNGGVVLEIRVFNKTDLSKIRLDLLKLKLGSVKLQSIGNNNRDILIRLNYNIKTCNSDILKRVVNILGKNIEYRRIDSVGPSVSKSLRINVVLSIIISIIAMLLYIWFRFDWQFSLCAIFALIHDALIVLGVYSLFGLEFNEMVMIAILTTIVYSINDTVVIYDRIREKLKNFQNKTLFDIVNTSINENLSRTFLTSISTSVALFSLCCFGGIMIFTFSFPIMIGVIIGTYSSICLASIFLLMFKINYN